MPTIGYRSGRVGVLATLVLLLSIVLFVGCLFWLGVNGPWGGSSFFGDDLFKPASMTPQQPEEITLNSTGENILNMTEAVDELQEMGCIFTQYTGTYSEDDTISLSFPEFKEIAVSRKIVLTSEITPETPVLLVITDGKIYAWKP